MKKIYKVCNEELVFKISVYQLNSPLMAVKAFRKTGEPYVTVSYNPHLEYSAPCNTFLVDIYACKEIKEILKVLGAKPCMKDGNPVVGFDCVSIYQLYRLDSDTLTKMDPEGYALYLSMRSKSMGI